MSTKKPPTEGAFLVPGVALPELPVATFKLWQTGNTTSAPGYSTQDVKAFAALYGQLVLAQQAAAQSELLTLLIESQECIGGDWRERRDSAIAKAQGRPS